MTIWLKKARWSIFVAQSASYLLIILFLSATFGFFFFSTAKSHLEAEVGKKLQDIASIASRNAPFDRLSLIKPGDDETRMVLRLKEKLGEIREATGTKNIFIFRTDLSSLVDLAPDVQIGSRYILTHFRQDFFKELDKGKPVSTGSYRMGAGNLFISAYAPVMDIDNRLFAVVGVDAGTREIEVFEQMRMRFFLIAGIGTMLAFLLSLALARRLTNPIREMASTAESIGQGDYKARVAIPSTQELAALAESINRMAEQVRNRDTKLKEMSVSVGHEIRNPLNSIKLLITLLEEEMGENKNASQQSTIDTLHQEIGKLARFLTEFLTFSRPMVLNRDEVSPRDLALRVVELSSAEAKEHEVRIVVQAADGLPPMQCDRDRLEQSLLNLILNAIQAADKNGEVRLFVDRSTEDGGVDFIVEDTGNGIGAKSIDRIFEPFFTTKETGTGLGLSNAKKIVNSHGGTIRAENIPGGGARFTIHLPKDAFVLKGKSDGHVPDC